MIFTSSRNLADTRSTRTRKWSLQNRPHMVKTKIHRTQMLPSI